MPRTVAIPRAEISAIKAALKRRYKIDLAEGRSGAAATYGEMVRIISHPAAVLRVQMVPGSVALQQLQNVLIGVSRTVLLMTVVVWVLTDWMWATTYFAVWLGAVSPAQTALNFEIGARLFALDQRLVAEEDAA